MKKMNSLVAMFLSVMPLFFVSCDNFLSGNEVKESLENEINWAKLSEPLKVEKTFPAFSSKGVYQDSSIEIMFNKPVNPATFKYSIFNGSDSFNEFYCEPEFFLENTVVKFRANPDNPVNLVLGQVADVTVVIDKNLKAADGSAFAREDFSFNYKLNHTKDDVAPTVSALKVYKYNPVTSEKCYLKRADVLAFDQWTDEDYAIHHLGSLGIECEIRDNCSGPAGVLLTEEFLYTKEGVKIDWSRKQSSVTKLSFKTVKEDLTLFTADEIVPFYYEDDGIMKITLQIVDGNGNVSAEKFSYYILKDTSFSCAVNTKAIIYNLPFEGYDGDEVDMSAVAAQDSETVCLEAKFDEIYYPGKSTDPEKFFVKFETGASKDDMTFETTDVTYENGKWTAQVKFSDPEINNYIKVSLYDEAGNVWSMTELFPGRTKLYSGTNKTSADDSYLFSYNSYSSKFNVYWLEKTDGADPDKDKYTRVKSYPQYFNVPEGKTYYVYYQAWFYLDSCTMYAPLSKRYELSNVINCQDTIEAVPPQIDWNYDPETCVLSIKTTDDPVNGYYDGFDVSVSGNGNRTYSMSKNDGGFVSKINMRYFRNNNASVRISGIKNGYPYLDGNECEFEFYVSEQKTLFEEPSPGRNFFTLEDSRLYIKCGTRDFIGCVKDTEDPELSYKMKVYYQLDNEISLEKLDEVPFVETSTYKGILLSYFVTGKYHFRYELFPVSETAEKRIVSEDFSIALNFDNGIKVKTNFDVPASFLAYFQPTQGGENTTAWPLAYNKDSGLVRWMENNWLQSPFYDNYLFNKGSKTLFKTFEFIFELNEQELKSEYIAVAKVFDNENLKWSNQFGLTADRTAWKEKEQKFIVNTGRDTSRATMSGIFWGNEFVKIWVSKGAYATSVAYDFVDFSHLNNLNLDSTSASCTIFAPVYLYLDNLTGDPEYPDGGKIKNMIDSGYMLTLFCDAPVYVHTVYSDKNLGKCDNWETKGFSVNERVVKETGNLDLDLSKIPDGMYYTTIAWFIDGTYVMGGVHQKGVEE